MPIFVSYSRDDAKTVTQLAEGLAAAGRDTWYDADLSGGEAWWTEILKNIRQAEVVVFALSDNSLRSKPCRAELNYALALRRTIVPIQVGHVTNFRANPLSELQTIQFRPKDAHSAFEVIAAVNEAAQRCCPLPEDLPDEPPIPYAYLVSLNKQIDNEALGPNAQIEVIDQLRNAFRDEIEDSVLDDIMAVLRKLKLQTWTTVRAAREADDLLASMDKRRAATASDTRVHDQSTESPPTSHTEESADEEERRRRKALEENMAREREQQQRWPTQNTSGSSNARPADAHRPPAPAETRFVPPSRPAENLQPAGQRFGGGTNQLNVGTPRPGPNPAQFGTPRPSPNPAQFPGQVPWQQMPRPPQGPATRFPPNSPTSFAPAPPRSGVTAPRPSPHWGWSIVGVVFSLVFGLVALYFSSQVGQRYERGDVEGARKASSYARVWGIVGLAVGLFALIVYSTN